MYEGYNFLFVTLRLAKRIAALKLATVMSTPNVTPPHPKSAAYTADWASGSESQSSEDENEARSGAKLAIAAFSNAMESLSQVATNAGRVSPLMFQLKTSWDEASEQEKEVCIDKATEACHLVCDIIAPKAGPELFQSCVTPEKDSHFSDLVPLMEAYSIASTKNVKTQILSLYAYRYSVKTLQRIHEPYAKLTEWQIKCARAHARDCGPGSLVETSPSHRVCLPPAKLDHFLDFVNRPYFYQDVAFGTRKLRLSSGENITMPNVIRKVTRATMVKQYLQFCEEEQFEPLSRATLFRVLEVREASQQKSLSGLDNIAGDGSAGFERLDRVVDELNQIGLEKDVADELRRSLRDGKRYFKTEYQSHCHVDESQCPDHCRKLGLSDPKDPDFQEHCTHQHMLRCPQCDEITLCLQKMQQIVKDGKNLRFYSQEQQNDFLYDIENSSEAIIKWKAHIMRSVNQDHAKQDILAKLDQSSCLVIMDWAMKFLQLRYREKQDWYGKRGLSWHISSVVSRSQSGTTEVISYAHLFDQCTQDWYAVTSILEDLFKLVKLKNPELQRVYLRSDEAGCYHNSSLILAVRDVAERVGVTVQNYHYSEPQSGKDICDRILCPMKSSIRTYCNEGHDVLTAVDMRNALTEHPVKGTTAAVSVVKESEKSLSVNKIEQFSSLHNFQYEDSGLRVWKCYDIGKGKFLPYDDFYIKHQGPTLLQTAESNGFYDPPEKREVKRRLEVSKKVECPVPLFECSVPGCVESFETFGQLELHLDVGKHTVSRVSQYDAIRRDWALKFSSVDTADVKSCSSDSKGSKPLPGDIADAPPLQTGWALSKPRSNVRFSQKVKEYLTARFSLGERSGRKADPAQVAVDMRNAKNESNERLFTRTEWMTKTQVQSFFSRLAATRRKDQGMVGISPDQEEDAECLQEDANRQDLIEKVNTQLNVSHPICYDKFDLCERYHSNTLQEFSVAMLKIICGHFEIPVKWRDKKKVLIDKLSEMIRKCECVSH